VTVYANVVDDEVKGVYDLIPKFWNGQNNFNILCNNDAEFMRNNGFVKIIRDTTAYDVSTHRMSDFPTYSVSNGDVYEHREITVIPPVVPPSREDLLILVREKRDTLMAEFEWRYTRYERQVRLNITPTDNIANLDAYMQALADITAREDLTNLVWPTYQE
jgi:hypothetical protein